MVKYKEKISILVLYIIISTSTLSAQFTDGITGLLHIPNALTQKDGTFFLGGNYLNYRKVPFITSKHIYNTYNYFINITLFSRLEIAYICTLNQGIPYHSYWPQSTWGRYTNQDRHFAGKFQIVKEGEWWNHMPSIAVGVSDPTTGQNGKDYSGISVGSIGNGYFNRWYAAISKHFYYKGIGNFGVHATYLYNQRTDYPLNGLGWGINFRPDFHRNLNLIVEHDTKTLNVGALYSLWADHFNVLFELQDCKYISAGFVYKVNLLGGNRWNSKLFDY